MIQECSRYEILKLKKNKELVFLIKKLYWKELEEGSIEESVLDEGLKIYFRQLHTPAGQYNHSPWSIKWERNFNIEGHSKVIYADPDVGIFEVDKKYRRNGLGSYLLDSLTQWAQEKCDGATVDIRKPTVWNDKFNKDEVEGFYGLRNLNSGVKVSQVKTFMKKSQESGKAEVISPVDYLKELSEENSDLKDCNDRLLKDKQSTEDSLRQYIDQSIREEDKNKRLALLLIAVSSAIGWFLGSKFG